MKRISTSRRATFILTASWIAAMGFASSERPAQAAGDFKFPAVLCVYRYSMISPRNSSGVTTGSNELYGFDTGEQALRVQNITQSSHGSSGEISAEYAIADTAYRFRFEGKVSQNPGSDQIQLRTFLERRDSATGNYVLVGQKTSVVDGTESPQGTISKNAYARAANHELDAYRGADGKIDPAKVAQGVQSGKLSAGTVFNAGPVCGLMDIRTVKQVTSHTQELADLLNPVSDPVFVAQASSFAASPSVVALSAAPTPTPTLTPAPAPGNEFDQAYPEVSENTLLNTVSNAEAQHLDREEQDRQLAAAVAEAQAQANHEMTQNVGDTQAPTPSETPVMVASLPPATPPSGGSAF